MGAGELGVMPMAGKGNTLKEAVSDCEPQALLTVNLTWYVPAAKLEIAAKSFTVRSVPARLGVGVVPLPVMAQANFSMSPVAFVVKSTALPWQYEG